MPSTTFYNLPAEKRERLELSALVSARLDAYAELLEQRGMTLELRLTPGVYVEGDAALLGRVRQILGRLLRLLTRPEHSLFQLNALMMELADLCASGAHRPMESIPLQSPLHESSRRAIRRSTFGGSPDAGLSPQ